MKLQYTPLALALACAHASVQAADAANATEATPLAPVVVTAPAPQTPLKTVIDPRAAQQPLPAGDGADLLKTIPGMSVIRKGGTDGDPVFRGMAASRLNILLDGEMILGGCGMRMDPPTAYVFPDSYDAVTLLKGPQSVQYGPGASAATVLFERQPRQFPEAGWRADAALTVASFDRHDEMLDVAAGNPSFQARAIATRNASNDYRDGNGDDVHSEYKRWSNTAILSWTPDQDTRWELSAARSDGEAAYADRSMDGVRFSRDNLGLKFSRERLSPLLRKLEAQLYYNYVDHVMDNYSLRTATGMRMLSNPDRTTVGGRIAATLQPADSLQLVAGFDFQRNQHRLRSAMGAATATYDQLPWQDDARFGQWGLFAEGTWWLAEARRVVGGLRSDHWTAVDQRGGSIVLKSTTGMETISNPSSGDERHSQLSSGFLRYEQDLSAATTVYAGLGHAERFPDYWELISANKESDTGNSAFGTRPEKTTQLDLGASHRAGPLNATLSTFYSRVDDFILVESGVLKTGRKIASLITRNVDARTYGLEGSVSYRLTPAWSTDFSLAWTHGDNLTEDRPLGQIPPLEARWGVSWASGPWSAGGLLRAVTGQHRVAKNEGNVVGQDLGASAGFGVVSLNAGYAANDKLTIQAGVDNLFDKAYVEHLSRSGSAAMVAGYPSTFQVNEPGRTFWLKARLALD